MGKFIYFSMIVLIIFSFFGSGCSATAHKRSFGEVVDDNVIAVKLHSKFVAEKEIASSHIKIKVWRGVVTLKGYAPKQSSIDKAIIIAEKQQGVKEVKSYLLLKNKKIKKKSASSFWSFLKKTPKKSKEKNSKVIEKDLGESVNSNVTNKSATKDEEDFIEIEY